MNESIFSTYSTGENRVTASIMAVLRCLALPRIERILAALTGDADFELVRFQLQPGKGGEGVPDGEIGSSFRILLETKRFRNAVNDREQLDRHLKRLKPHAEATQLVLLLTPDENPPDVVAEIGDPRLAWSKFAALDQVIEELLSADNNEKEVISEREEFLLRELQKMMVAEGLLGTTRGVLVIPARRAWFMYNHCHAYICKEGRPFQPAKHMAFYAQNQIYPLVPLVLERHDKVDFDRIDYEGLLGKVVAKAREVSESLEWPYKLSIQKVIILSSPDAPETVKLKKPIANATTAKAGQRIAFTQNQRYVTLEAIQKAKTTKDLVGD